MDSNQNTLLEEVYSALESFCNDRRWEYTQQGEALSKLAELLGKPLPYEDNE